MKSLKSKLHELELNEGGFYKNAGGIVRPSSRLELMKEINIRLKRGQTNLNDIDVSKITDMSYLFTGWFRNKLDIDISEWDVSNVNDMTAMFANCPNFNSDLSKWDVSKVVDMRNMFYECPNFNCDLSDWNVSKVKDIRCMFFNCHKFNSDLSRWNTSKVEYMIFAFDGSGVTPLPEWYRDNNKGLII